ncbi:MAG: phosphate ABC transporter substrate-binding protein [Planctomycetota bacterium]
MKTLMSLLLLVSVALITGCGDSSTPKAPATGASSKDVLAGKLVLTGSSTVAPLVTELGKRFEKLHPGVRIDVQTGGSSRGIADARSGVADLGQVSRSLKDDEKDLRAFTIALDGVCVILNKDNAVKELSDKQVIDIYLGKIANWKDVGGKDAPITVVNKAEGTSTLELFCHYYKLKPNDIKAHVIIVDNQQGIKTVAGNANSIGYVSIGSAEYESSHGVAIKLLPVGGVDASMANVKAHTFPLMRELNLVTKLEEPTGVKKAFLDFCTSKEANESIKELFFVPIKE